MLAIVSLEVATGYGDCLSLTTAQYVFERAALASVEG